MERSATWGTLGFLAVAAIVGVSMQTASNRGGETDRRGGPVFANHIPAEASKVSGTDNERACGDIARVLQTFLAIEDAPRPRSCYPPPHSKQGGQKVQKVAAPPITPQPGAASSTPDLRFVIATLPDPVHTHLALTFDRFTEVIQDAAQDEGYSYETSWLPWDEESQNYPLLADADKADDRKDLRESQPGILVFRNTRRSNGSSATALQPYWHGLIVFVVGEDPTRGIHASQFANALAWASELRAWDRQSGSRLAFLGPSFSGSFPSLATLMSTGESSAYLRDMRAGSPDPLPIFSGTANSGGAIVEFEKSLHEGSILRTLHAGFRSFMESDEIVLQRYCLYAKTSVDPKQIAVISEDETAYGGASEIAEGKTAYEGSGIQDCLKPALRLYYPRDISALRAAYQKNSIFSATAPQQSSEIPRNGLPTNLADPEGDEHDAVRSYAGEQTALSQEAYLLGVVNALRGRHIDYVILRSTNPLDQLFLSTYLRRAYPEARIITDGADRLFEREQGATEMRGTMTLSTYPLLEDERDWIGGSSSPYHRSFNSDASEGAYNALRLLLHSTALSSPTDPCALLPANSVPQPGSYPPSLPVLSPECNASLKMPLPDYGSLSWLTSGKGQKDSGRGEPPPTWLSVLANEGFWAIAALHDQEPSSPWDGDKLTKVPVSLKLFLVLLAGFIGFHLWCCWRSSFTAKPAFRAHFANLVEWKRHVALICLGSSFAAFLPLLVGWGCGAFDPSSNMLAHGRWLLCALLLEGGIALAAGPVNILRVEKLEGAGKRRPTPCALIAWVLGGSALLVVLLLFTTAWMQNALSHDNRFFTYYRNMHIMSGASGIVPLVALSVGMYAWFWHSLHGLALFGTDGCKLPKEADLKFPDRYDSKNLLDYLRMFSQEAVDPTELGAKPFDRNVLLAGGGFCVLSIALVYTVPYEGTWPVRTLVAQRYAYVFLGWVLVCFSLLFMEAWQLLLTWTRLRALLVFLDRTPLRRTLAALRGFSWGTVWGMSGNVLDVRYKLLSRQMESLGHAHKALEDRVIQAASDAARCCISARSCIAVLTKLKGESEEGKCHVSADDFLVALESLSKSVEGSSLQRKLDNARDSIVAGKLVGAIADPNSVSAVEECTAAIEEFMAFQSEKVALAELECIAALDRTYDTGLEFAGWYSKYYDDSDAGHPETLNAFQLSVAETTAKLLVRLLLPEWRKETRSLVLEESKAGDVQGESRQVAPPLSKKRYVRDAEEFVCLPYLGFVQNILGRMRSMVMSILWLFVAITVAISSYPFDPREGLSATMLAVFLALGAVICYVYWQMHRDATLSRITNTTPGELGVEFWLKLAGFGAAPLLGLLATHFPGIAALFTSWLQPGLQAIK